MKLLEYADKLWVDVSDNAVRDDIPFLCLGPKTYTEFCTHFKCEYNVDIVYTNYINQDDGVYLYVQLKEEYIDIKTLDIIAGDWGKIKIGSDYSPGEYDCLCLSIPIEQEVESFKIKQL